MRGADPHVPVVPLYIGIYRRVRGLVPAPGDLGEARQRPGGVGVDDDAGGVGVDGALVLQQVHYWISNPKIGRVSDGRRWVRNSIEEWKRDNFPFWSNSKISRVITKLEAIDLLDSRVQGFFDHLNRDSGEQTWSTRSSNMFNTELHRPAGFGEDEE